jgi:hypothetical protein
MGRSPFVSRRLTNPIVSSATQFLSFIPKQIEELSSQAMRDPGKIAQYLMFSGYYSYHMAQASGIDTSNYVGLGFITTKPDQLVSPGVDLAVKFFDMTAAWGNLNPDEADRTTADFIDTARILAVPGGAGLTAMLRGAERITSGEQLTMQGVKMRNLDFKHLDVLHNPSLETLGAALNPDVAEGPTSKLPGVGGDLIPTVFGQQSIRDALFARGNQANKREKTRFAREVRILSQDLASAIEDGDMQKAEELTHQFEDITKVRIGNLKGVDRAIYARNVSQIIRDIEDDPVLIDRFLKIANDFGMDVKP